MRKYQVISTDDHAVEPPDLWQKRLPAKFKEHGPKVVRSQDGTDRWTIAGEPQGRSAWLSVRAGRYDSFPRNWDEVPAAIKDPKERTKDMDRDGVDAHVLFPNTAGGIAGQSLAKVRDLEASLACVQVYNTWLAQEFCAAAPDRLVPLCILPIWDLKAAVAELQRARKLGHKGLVLSSAPDQALGLPHLNERHWDPLWAAAQDLGMPVNIHILTGQLVPNPWKGFGPQTDFALRSVWNVSAHAIVIADLLFSGILERFPRLQFVSVESGIGWVPYCLEMADYHAERYQVRKEGVLTMRPSEYFRRQVFASFWLEKVGPEIREAVGLDNIVWESDYPHPTSTFPNSREYIERAFKGVSEQDRHHVLVENAVRLFQIGAA